MPTLPEIAERLSLLVTTSATLSVMVTAGVIVVIKDWRASLLALVIQYAIVGLLLMSAIRTELALIKTLVGAFLCVVLYVTARRVAWGQSPPQSMQPEAEVEVELEQQSVFQWTLPTELPFRFLAVVVVLVAAYSAASAFPLPDVSEAIGLSTYILAALGLLAMGLTDEPLKAGLGLLTFFSAFELFYTVLEPSLIVVGFLGLSNFLISLAIAYLTVARYALADLEGS